MSILKKLRLTDSFGITSLGLIVLMGWALMCLASAAFAIDAVSCSQYADSTGRKTTYKVPAGCYVAFGDAFIPIDEYEARAITHTKAK